MSKRTPLAGGFFLVAPIIVGFTWGLLHGNAMIATLIGLGIGLVLAIAVALVDRRAA